MVASMSYTWGPDGEKIRRLAVADVLAGAALFTAAARWRVRGHDLARWVAAAKAEQPAERTSPTGPPAEPPTT
ncbi:hypothetical protein BJF78_14050 [Pseudonocardia sp. CNS-139]|nr:hypothetical protein BJF78_14050 [Pseudonocardia sp. CNS-139]